MKCDTHAEVRMQGRISLRVCVHNADRRVKHADRRLNVSMNIREGV